MNCKEYDLEEIYQALISLTDVLYLISDGLNKQNEKGGNAVAVIASVQTDLLAKLQEIVYKD